ncbi:hypothetical protein KI387_025941, partial [Taxus chinensis]
TLLIQGSIQIYNMKVEYLYSLVLQALDFIANKNFEEIAELLKVCWFEVQGQFDCKLLSLGIAYTVSFKLKLHESARNRPPSLGRMIHVLYMSNRSLDEWDRKPVKFSITTSLGYHRESARFLQTTDKPVDDEGYQMTSLRHVGR